jgi:hypothetical protein
MIINLNKTLKILSMTMIVALSGCGYSIGTSMMHPQIKSIAIAPVTNDTVTYNVSALVRGMLCETFNVDGSVKLKDMSKADCILYCRVTQIVVNQVTRGGNRNHGSDDDDFRTGEWKVTITAEITVIIPGRKEPLLPVRNVTGSAFYQIQADPTTNRRYGIEQAGYDMSKKIVVAVTQAW